MKYLDVCSGISAPTAAWKLLGWKAAAFSEVEAFPSAILAHHYPETPNLGDMTNYGNWNIGTLDLLVGGTPCQAFSVAGFRGGLADPRGNLTLVYLGLADRFRPRWLVWENVPGVLSIDAGRTFGSFLGGLAKLGYGWAYRVLDAQFFGVAQRRRRVFVVAHLRDWRRAAEVLFEPDCLRGNPAPRQGSREGIAGTLTSGSGGGRYDKQPHNLAPALTASFADKQGLDNQHIDGGGGISLPSVAGCLQWRDGKGPDSNTNPGHLIPILQGGFFDEATHTLRGEGFDANEDGTGRGTPLVPFYASQSGDSRLGMSVPGVPPVRCTQPIGLLQGAAVRRLTPRECERLQGFPDDFTRIPWRGRSAEECPDGPRYKALGNSMAVPVVTWIGRRIQMVEEM
jgi:DNA (cytosine-5)-methyltransferase 1